MPSIFLSHTSIDKPFVEKLARDLRRIGVNVWYDRWVIKVGDSIVWKTEEGIRENEYLGIVLSPEALSSEWVKSELGSAWVKQMQTRKVVVLPIYYRDCSIPYFLADRKYADFRDDYQFWLEELAEVLGMKNVDTISLDNWRKYTRVKGSKWQEYREEEFERLVTTLVDRVIEYNWSSWVGGTSNPLSITFFARNDEHRQSVSIRLDKKTNSYFASLEDNWNPNRIPISGFTIYVGNSINECEEFLWRQMDDFKSNYGNPPGKSTHVVRRHVSDTDILKLTRKIVNELRWYKGDKL
jgi:hypothetical protein